MSPVQTSLRSTLTGKFDVPESEIVPDATLESLGLDSLSLAELALILQEELGVEIQDDEAAARTTVGELTQTLATKYAATPGPTAR
ncbi:acyl carrier protein [Kitasatospora sp. NPDC002227]|uniref:acyl carrier protein n=1 Tax=Kitasatospora sp. NPDC002227 TaxID=3154773 RepID=UPI00331BC7E2